jgi:mannitol-1-/sugar-/sorbitol-6-phosphatase
MREESTLTMLLSYAGVCFDLFGTLVTGEGRPIEGARAALELLPKERWAIVTSCGSRFARALIAAAELPSPRVLVSADDVTRGKPAPEPYALAASGLRLSPQRIVVIEDSRDGIASGRAAGMDVIAIARGRGSAFASEAIAVVKRFEDLHWSVKDDGSIDVAIRDPHGTQGT